GLTGNRVARMQMGDGRSRLRRLDRRIRDLPGRHRNGRVLADSVARAGDGAADDDVLIHGDALAKRSGELMPAASRLMTGGDSELADCDADVVSGRAQPGREG